MSRFTKAEQLFLQLYRSALWADLPQEAPLALRADEATWLQVADVAEGQTCQGLLADALSRLPLESRPPKSVYFSLVTATADAEDANRKMNHYLRGLFPMLERQGIRAWLLKGQGLAQCYPQPTHRLSGDMDVLIPRKEEFERAVRIFSARLPRGNQEDEGRYERTFCLDGIVIELHSRVVTDLNPRFRRRFPAWSWTYYEQEPVRWGDVSLPPVDFDAVFVFVHLARHYVGGGIGLRQVADWMRFLYVHRADGQHPIDVARLEHDVAHLGLRRLWKVFAAMAVHHLGCPASVMPLYDASPRYRKAADAVLRSILDEGNFGYHDAAMDQRPHGFLAGKAFSFLVQARRMAYKFRYFPVETLYCFPQLVIGGLGRVAGRK